MQVNFGRIFVTKDILGSSDYSNTNTYLKIVHPTSGGGGGMVLLYHLKHASHKKWRG